MKDIIEEGNGKNIVFSKLISAKFLDCVERILDKVPNWIEGNEDQTSSITTAGMIGERFGGEALPLSFMQMLMDHGCLHLNFGLKTAIWLGNQVLLRFFLDNGVSFVGESVNDYPSS